MSKKPQKGSSDLLIKITLFPTTTFPGKTFKSLSEPINLYPWTGPARVGSTRHHSLR